MILSLSVITLGQAKKIVGNTTINDAGTDIQRSIVLGVKAVNKFGDAPSGVQTTSTDIWDRADATPTQQIWVAPTAARVHYIEGNALDVPSVGTLTFAGNPGDLDTIIIGSKTYVFDDTLEAVDGHVLIGADSITSINNLVAAINLSDTAGTNYAAAMTSNASTAARSNATMLLYTTAATATATTETGDDLSWGAATTVVGTGAHTIRVYGLPTWSTTETYEDIAMMGTDSATTTNSYVIIHRMKVLTKGDSLSNVGAITATAGTDATITAVILANRGQTLMAIYGVPSGETAYLKSWYGDILKAQGGVATIEYSLLVNPEPDAQLTNFLTKSHRGVQSTGTSSGNWYYDPPMAFAGPCIIKVQGLGSGSDLDGSAGFNLIVE